MRGHERDDPNWRVVEAFRANGGVSGDHVIAAVAWSIGIAVVGYLWAVRLYNRRRATEPQ